MSTSSPATTAQTTCCYCGVGCGVEVKQDASGRLSVSGDEEHPVNQGMLCSKGRNLHQVAMDRQDRLRHPQMCAGDGGALERASWDDALGHTAATFRRLIDAHGPASVGFYVSGQFLTEEYYLANKLMKGFIGANNIDTNSRLCMSSAVVGYQKALGEDTPPISYDDIESADCFLIAGANPAWCHPILFRRIERHKEQHPDTTVIVADPRETDTCALADLHLPLRPGTDTTFFNAVAAHLVEHDLVDRDFIQKHTERYETLRDHLQGVNVRRAASVCEVSENKIRRAAEHIGNAGSFLSMWAMGLNQSAQGTDKNLALLNLSLLTGQIGKPGAGPFSLTGQPNAMGGREVGGMAGKLAAHHDLSDPVHRARVSSFWGGKPISAEPGYAATEMIDALDDGRMKAVWIMCTNPVSSMPDARRVERAFEKAELVVVQDISRTTDTLPYADVVLPAAGWLEKQGTMTNSDRRVSYLPQVIDPPGEARPDAWILCDFAERMGWGESFDYADESEIFDEHAALTKGTNIDVSGLSYERLQEERSVQWPCPSEEHPGTERLFTDGQFFTDTNKARFHAVAGEERSAELSGEFPLILTTGRIRDQWHTMTKTGTVNRLKQHIDRPTLHMHPADAKTRGLEDGETVEVESRQGQVRVAVEVTTRIREGVVFLPMHWGKKIGDDRGRANNLTAARVDPDSKQPAFKYTPVQVQKPQKPADRVVVVGAGAAARQFVESYRSHNDRDELVVFGREPHLFYNRVLLPEYISGHRDWAGLLTCEEGMAERLDVTFHRGTEIVDVDREAECVEDGQGRCHDYDRLVLCTGSRAFIPPGVPMERDGVFSVRKREDAERIKEHLAPDARAVIMGGGLLGLELAAELDRIGVHCTIVELQERLMQRQLDDTAGTLLREELEERGLRIRCDDMITEYPGAGPIEQVKTREGEVIDCEALFVAVGTRPNVGLAKEADLEVERGVVVNDRMQTSDPAVYAIGEIAEHEGALYGITPAANEQADVAAAHLSGEAWSQYDGSLNFNILKISGLEVRAMGTVQPPADDDAYEEIVFLDRRRRCYKKCVVHNNRLVGAVLIGDATGFADFKYLVEEGMELNGRRSELLRPGASAAVDPPEGKLVCSCNNVGAGNLETLIADGCTELDQLRQESRAGTGCGSCIPEVKMLLEDACAPTA